MGTTTRSRLLSTNTTAKHLDALGGKTHVQNEIDRMHKEGSERFGWRWYLANRLTAKGYHTVADTYDTSHNALLQYMAVKIAWAICERDEDEPEQPKEESEPETSEG